MSLSEPKLCHSINTEGHANTKKDHNGRYQQATPRPSCFSRELGRNGRRLAPGASSRSGETCHKVADCPGKSGTPNAPHPCNCMQYLSFSRVDSVVFNQLGVELKPMTLLEEKRTEIEALGLAESEGNRLSIDTTKELLRLIRSHVSRAVGIYQALQSLFVPLTYLFSQNEAGSRILINMFLLRLASVMNHKEAEVNIIPEFPISKTTLQSRSFGGVVDFLVTQGHSKYNSAPTDS